MGKGQCNHMLHEDEKLVCVLLIMRVLGRWVDRGIWYCAHLANYRRGQVYEFSAFVSSMVMSLLEMAFWFERCVCSLVLTFDTCLVMISTTLPFNYHDITTRYKQLFNMLKDIAEVYIHSPPRPHTYHRHHPHPLTFPPRHWHSQPPIHDKHHAHPAPACPPSYH